MSSAARADGAPTSRAELARELAWWVRHGPRGRSKVAALAPRVGVSASTLYAWLSGATLPPAGALDDLLLVLEVPAADQRRLATARDELQGSRRATPAAVPQELPPAPSFLEGREVLLHELDDALARSRAGRGPGVVVLCGIAGVGKTALALAWAHARADDFPDGRLHVDLRGFSPGAPVAAADAAGTLLRSLGEPAGSVPEEPAERSARLRSLLAGRSVLLVLDNALDVEQVRPLLPGDSTCLAVVTSRDRLDGLLVEPGAVRLPVEPLAPEVAERLVLERSSYDLDETVGREIARRCHGLPLALRLVMARLASSRDGGRRLLEDLQGSSTLDELDVGDPATSMRSVLSWSEARLTDAAASALVLLGVLDWQHVEAAEAAELWQVEEREAARLLGELERAHLVEPTADARRGLHDLVREWARERAAEVLTPAEQDDARHRLVRGVRRQLEIRVGTESEAARTTVDTAPWIERRWPDLVAAMEVAQRCGWWEDVAALAHALGSQVDIQGRHSDGRSIFAGELAAARALGDPVREARALTRMGMVESQIGRFAEARRHLGEAMAIAEGTEVPFAIAGALCNVGSLERTVGNLEEAEALFQRGLALCEELDFEPGVAIFTINLAYVDLDRGRSPSGERNAREARRIALACDPPVAARALGQIGRALQQQGRSDEARSVVQDALEECRRLAARSMEAEALGLLGDVERSRGELDAARRCHGESLEIAREIGEPTAEAVARAGLGDVAASQGDAAQARAHRAAAEDLWRGLDMDVDVQLRRRAADRGQSS